MIAPPSPPKLRSWIQTAPLLLIGVVGLGTISPSQAETPAKRVPSQGSRSTPTTPTRLYADSFLLWIYQAPKRSPSPIGYLRGGQSAALRAEGSFSPGEPVKKGCGKGWYAVEPAGYVCLDRKASLRPTLYSKSMATLRPKQGAFPFAFALSMGSPSYRRIPTPSEWQRKERIFGPARIRTLPPHWRGHEGLVGGASLPLQEPPSFLRNGSSVARSPEKRLVRRDVPFGSMLAISRAFESAGREFLQSADGTIVPAERFRVFKKSQFEGIELAQNAGDHSKFSLPVAWPRKKTRLYSISSEAKCALDGSGTPTSQIVAEQGVPGRIGRRPAQLPRSCLIVLSSSAQPRTPLQLSGRTVDVAGTRFVEKLPRAWLPLRYLYLAEGRTSPRGERERDGSPRKWIHFKISQGTLVSYLGGSPLFATLASPGEGGTPVRGADPLTTRTTPVGVYRIQFKHQSDDMSPEQKEHRDFWIADVPHTMYFHQPFAIHVAYWHESFGEPMSGGCINVSPKDGARLFEFTDPRLPPDWYGVGASRSFGLGTTVVIDR